jgi:drug/metabolite transporter (DMT)-like permease
MNSSSHTGNARSIFILVFGAVCISFAAIFVKMIDPSALGPTAIGFWRLFIGAVILFVWSAAAGHSLKLPSSIVKWVALAGLLFFLDIFAWHRSIVYSGAGMATILANTQVFSTAVMSFFVFKEKLSVKFIVTALSAIVGVVILVGVGSGVEFTSLYIRGVLFGLATGVFYGNYLVTIKYAGEKAQRPHLLTLMAWISLVSAICLGASGLIEPGPMLPPDAYSWIVLVALAFVAQALGWWSISTALSRLEGSHSGLILLLQPVLTTIWGVLFFAEYLTVMQIVGAAITLTAIYIGSVRR